MKRRDLIYIIVILGLIIAGYFWRSNYEENIILINKENTRLNGEVEMLVGKVSENEIMLDIYAGKIAAGTAQIDSLKNIEHEIPIIIVDDIPVSKRNSTIRRLAAK